ncbi:MAG: Threonine-tRNA ligase [Candidatus Jorgensenbacteria bacterium GW2011_GWB1_49_9]|nr:MAG: Threonine-tRNA ligase [Candidatus Jorgensenbacteria bacterium GW2011_GWB1_49_9]
MVNLDNVRHSLAHLLAAAVLKKFPKAQLGIGPVIQDGFYYDFKLPRTLTPADLADFENEMRDLIGAELAFRGKKVKPAEAKKIFKHQPFKLDLIKDFTKEKKSLTIYRTGDVFLDLCRGGHVKNTKEINPRAFKLTHIAGAYWKGDAKNPQLQRIYGLAFAAEKELNGYLKMQEEAKKRDHKILGPALDLFAFSDLVGAGLPLWTPKGTLLRNILDDFVWELREKYGYQKVEIPHITKKDLYEKSGHWEKFQEDLFKIKTREGHLFAMKPMNCPHHTQIYARRPWSYRELPQRYANTTMCYRDEQTGELSGLSRARSFTQDDAHVFCRLPQAKEEFLKIWDIVHEFYSKFGFNLRIRVSTHDPKHPEKYLGDRKKWAFAEKMLQAIVKDKKTDTFPGVGEAAFYGPKLDFMAKDSLGREWQVATIQLDVNMPERFDLTCMNEKGKPERIVMIHAAIMGSLERFLSIIIEHYAGDFPAWLAPQQVAILPISENQKSYALAVASELKAKKIRSETFAANDTLGKRIREAELQKIPYLLVLGDKEMNDKSVSVRERHQKESKVLPLETFIEKITAVVRGKL